MKEMTYRELAEHLIFTGWFAPELSWQQYEESLRWDWYINEETLERFAGENDIKLVDDGE